jgi:hypothetical protein
MNVFILTLRENNEGSRHLENLGVFQNRYSCLAHVFELKRAHNPRFVGGRTCSNSVDELHNREQELGFNPLRLIIYENNFYKAVAEISTLK